MEGFGRRFEKRLAPHFLSLILGNQIDVELGVRLTPHLEKYDKFMARGAGLGEVIKAGLILANQ